MLWLLMVTVTADSLPLNLVRQGGEGMVALQERLDP